MKSELRDEAYGREDIGDAMMQDYLLAVTTGEYGAVSVRDWREPEDEAVDPWAHDEDD